MTHHWHVDFMTGLLCLVAFTFAVACIVACIKRELDQAIADAEKRINDRENCKKDCP